MNDLAELKEREKEKLPDEYDIHGAAFGLVRLKSLYKFDLKSFVEEGVISTSLENGQIVISKPSVLRFNCKCILLYHFLAPMSRIKWEPRNIQGGNLGPLFFRGLKEIYLIR